MFRDPGSSMLRLKPALGVFAAGCLVTLLTPFVFLPETMSDAGVTHAGLFRNASAAIVLLVALAAIFTGLASLPWQSARHLGKR
jgi:hypothetical protein